MSQANPTLPVPTVRTSLHGGVPVDVAAYAQREIGFLARRSGEPIRQARVRVTRYRDLTRERPLVAQANLDVNGHQLRAQVLASTPRAAVDKLIARLRHRLDLIDRRWETPHADTRITDGWRYITMPTRQPAYYPRPVGDRRSIRRKSYPLTRCSVDDAVAEMLDMDYSFHLFIEAGSGEDSVLYRTTPSGFKLTQVTPRIDRVARHQLTLTIARHPAPRLGTRAALIRLDLSALPFLFYADAEHGRGRVLYHRYDGHYGLLTPVL